MSDKIIENNQVTVIGEVVSEFIYSHEVFGENRDPPLALDIVGVHDPLGDFLIFAEDTALF